MEGVDGAASAWVADKCNRELGQELSPGGEERHGDLAAKNTELGDCKKFDVCEPRNDCDVSRTGVQTRSVLTRKMMDGHKGDKARLVAEGYQDPGLREGIVDTPGCVSLRSSHLQVISLRAIKKWKLRSLDIKNAFLQADGFARNFFSINPQDGNRRANRARKLKAPAYGLNGAPVAFHRPLEGHLLNPGNVSRNGTLTPAFVFRGTGSAARVFTTRIDDIVGCGEPKGLIKIRQFLEQRSGELKRQDPSSFHAGMELAKKSDLCHLDAG